MSLDAIRQLRRAGMKPNRAIFVVIGDKPENLDDDAQAVIVRPTDNPRLMDWSPMVGLTAAVFTVAPLPGHTLAVLDALQAVNAKVFGAADATGFHPLLEGADEAHESLLRRTWELLCTK